MKKSLLIIALVAALGGGAIFTTVNAEDNAKPATTASTEQKMVTLDVPGMFCPTCPYTVRKSLEKLSGVMEVETSSDTKTAVVKYDPSKVDIDALIAATTNVGYPSTVHKCEADTKVC